MMKIFSVLTAAILFFTLVGTSPVLSGAPAVQETPEEKPLLPTPTTEVEQAPRPPMDQKAIPSPVDLAIQQAFVDTINEHRERNEVLGLIVYEPVIDYIQYAQNGSTALVWVGLIDPQTGELVATEPGLSVARSEPGEARESAAAWAITLPSDEAWVEEMKALPEDLLTEEVRNGFLLPAEQTAAAAAAQVFTGYKLPWPAGLEKRVTNSIGHYLTVSGGYASCPATCKFAYDFADGTMFPMLAARGGTVKAYKWTCANGSTDCTNYLILEDQSTVPTTYQIYYHLAYNSIPQRLRVIGAPVLQGEYIGDADDTGNSTGHHLHYHIYTSPTQTNWSWGYSVDFTFDDVAENGGRPRTCAEASQYPDLGSQCRPNNRYVSGNTPANPPSGSLSAPAHRSFITARTVRVSGTASDDLKVKRIQVVANYDGTWKSLGDITPTGNGPFSKDIDLCASGAEVPDGPFALTVKIFDYEGSQAPNIPVRQLIKNFNCAAASAPAPVSACTPGANQVALYQNPDYQGACTLFDANPGIYQTEALGEVGDNKAASVQVGSGVRAVLYDWSDDVGESEPAGRVETLETSDPGLADNRIGTACVSGLRVLPRGASPEQPYFSQPAGNSLASVGPTSVESLVLAWDGAAGATSFDVSLSGPGANWTKSTTCNNLSVGSLPAGAYTVNVTAKNASGSRAASSAISVSEASLPAASTLSVPYSNDYESSAGGWIGTGLWRYGSITIGNRASTKAWTFNDGVDYASASWRAGDLTSPPIAIPTSGTYYLRFRYFVDVENDFSNWDQRRVQISANGGPFVDLVTLSGDKQAAPIWLSSGAISLAQYAGQTIRVRFHFDTVDGEYNTGKGWVIDEVTVNNTAPELACADSVDSPAAAQQISINSTVPGIICPERDLDYYRFTGLAGQAVSLDIDARTLSPASLLDTVVYLIDSDGQSILAENDDEIYSTRVDSLLRYTFTRDGTYYIKVKAWNYPGKGGSQYFYNLKLTAESAPVPPHSIQITYPLARTAVPANLFEWTVSATDYDGGPVASVDFFWHGPDWSIPNWVKLPSDTDGSNGWSVNFNPTTYGAVKGSALYAQARSRTGGVRGIAWWDLEPDTSVPVTRLGALSSTPLRSTAVNLTWSAADALNDIVRFELQYQENGGAWKNAPGNPISKDSRSTWFVGRPGIRYGFRIRGIDGANNVEQYSTQPEATATIESPCTADAREADSISMTKAIPVGRNGLTGQYNLCKASAPASADEDWLMIQGQKDERLLLWAFAQGGGGGIKMSVYNSASTLIKSWSSPGFQSDAAGMFIVPETGKYYVKIEPFRSDLLGTSVYYRFWHGLANTYYIPEIHR